MCIRDSVGSEMCIRDRFVGVALNGVIELESVIPAGKSEMPATDWARGAHLLGGENFG
jgi:hypothetical protein